jgi:ATP-binding cassette, subfamily B, bacterial MsbA
VNDSDAAKRRSRGARSVKDAPSGTLSISSISRAVRGVGIGRRECAVAVFLSLCAVATEGLGLGILYLALAHVEGGAEGVARIGGPIRHFVSALAAVGLPITLGSLLLAATVPISVRIAVEMAQARFLAVARMRSLAKLRRQFAEKAIAAELPFHLAHNSAELQVVMLQQTQQASNTVPHLFTLLTTSTQIALGLAVLCFAAPTLLPLLLPAAVFFVAANRLQVGRSLELGVNSRNLNSQMAIAFGDALAGVRQVKLARAEISVARKVGVLVDQLVRNAIAEAMWRATLSSTMQPLIMLTVVLAIYIAVDVLQAPLAQIGLFAAVVVRIVGQISAHMQAWFGLANNTPALERLETLRDDAERLGRMDDGSRPFQGLRDGIAFEDVSFSHRTNDAEHRILNRISFLVPKGASVALVGRSGAGKSTIADLMARLYDPTFGAVRLDGHDLRDFDLGSYRGKIALVSQDVVLFDDTIRGNVLFGVDPVPTESAFRDALARARCLDFVDALPSGADTPIGERGARLSGGQRQRLAIARALVSAPEILILDEPTSALDSETERAVHEVLEGLKGTMTIVVIAHRHATVATADLVLVVDRGRLVQTGAPEDLASVEGVYRDLFHPNAQTDALLPGLVPPS